MYDGNGVCAHPAATRHSKRLLAYTPIHVSLPPARRCDCADTGKESDTYVGEWKEDKMHGQGRYTYAVSGDVYEGGWHDGLFHGEGKYTSADGAVYEGEYVAGERKGPITA